MKYLWTFKDLKRAVGLPTRGPDFDIRGVSIDSRTTKNGDAFVALKAERDGHDFVENAYKAGAVVAVVDHKVDCEIPQIVVDDTFNALWAMGDAQRDWGRAKRVAVTGSCGKTTTKELMGTALSCHKSEGSYNNHWGVPLTLARTPRDEKYAVYEVGMNHPGEIAPLSELIQPDVAVVLNIAPVHIGAFDSIEDIAVEKLSVTKGLKKGGKLVTSDEVYETYPAYFDEKPVLFSLKEGSDADVCLESVRPSSSGQNVVALVAGKPVSFRLHLMGLHAIADALAVLAVAHILGADMRKVCLGLEMVSPVVGRGNIHSLDGVTIIDESYNANPVSMKAALQSLATRPREGRRVAILGDMLELGDKSADYHAALAEDCADLDMVITIGDEMKHLHEALGKQIQTVHYDAAKDMNLCKFVRQLESQDSVMIKGSKDSLWVHNFVPRLLKEFEGNHKREEGAA